VSDRAPSRSVPSRAGEPAQGRRPGRPGRPPRIDRAAIARAAGEIPLAELTLRSVAERLGVSVPGLYHYVSGREDLIRLAAEQSALRMTMPVDHGQHWAVWLHEWAAYNRRAFIGDPELLKHFIDGAVGPEMTAPAIDRAIGPCMRQGFTAREALEAYDLVSQCGLGSAVAAIRDERSRREGSPFDLEVRALIARGERLPHLQRFLAEEAREASREDPGEASRQDPGEASGEAGPAEGAAGPAAPLPDSARFRRQITAVLAGIAALRGEPWEEIAALLTAATDSCG
jgi:AcrR family transcriptional regulator